jgi:NAD(P)-dependent dehydrogenase (short-subunit alcohol dehydrogenase family)
MKLKGKVALITGGNSGIGAATAKLFAAEGACVVIVGRNESRGNRVLAEIQAAGGEALWIACDVRNSAEARRAVQWTQREFGRLDILFNNAGIILRKNVVDMSEEEWDDNLDTNLKSAFLFAKFALPIMIEQHSGVIINNGSGWGLKGGPNAASYCASKAGLVNLTRAMALDHSAQGIRINCICPGDVDTPMLDDEARQLQQARATIVADGALRPMGRIGTVEEVARCVLFLASDDSSYMTGAVLTVDGGGTAG